MDLSTLQPPLGPDERAAPVSRLLDAALAMAKANYEQQVAELLQISRDDAGAPINARLDQDNRVWRWFVPPSAAT